MLSGSYFQGKTPGWVKRKCAMCCNPIELYETGRCPNCAQYPICQDCLLPVVGELELKVCLSCAEVTCLTCGWLGDSALNLAYAYPDGQNVLPVYICPDCGQLGVVAISSHTKTEFKNELIVAQIREIKALDNL